MAVTLNIVARTLFGADVSADAGHIGQIISELMEQFGRILGLAARFQPPGLGADADEPTVPGLRAQGRPGDPRIIDARRKQSDASADDLLSLLIRARDEDGSAMTDAQVRDEAVTLFLAGHETTALALTYSLYLLATHPECQARLAAELAEVLGGRTPGLADLESLKYTDAVVLEAMRLYPPAWVMARQALTDVEIGGFRFGKGAEFVMSPWVLHRDPANFDAPEAFQPERWQGDLAAAPAALRLLPLRRRPEGLHRKSLRDDGGEAGPRHRAPALSLRGHAADGAHVVAKRDPPPAARAAPAARGARD